MPRVKWATPAFNQLESIPEIIASEIIQRVGLLETFPEAGPTVFSQYPDLATLRHLIVDRAYRVIYENSLDADVIYILAVQHCRRRLPTAGELRRKLRRES